MNPNRIFARIGTVLILALLLGAAPHAFAHDPGLSSVMMVLLPDHVETTLAFAIKDAELLAPLDQNGDGLLSKQEFAETQDKLAARVAREFSVTFDGKPATPATAGCQLDDQNNVEIMLVFSGRPVSVLSIQSKLIAALPVGHRQFFTLEKLGDKPLVEQLLTADADTVTAEIGPADAAAAPEQSRNSFVNFLVMGMEHIWTGYDHLLFLIGLLMVMRNFKSSLQIITCFTIAHSITLAIATLHLVQIPARVVEPLIAASIVYVGLENLYSHGDPKHRWLLTFAFGLIHGFGFATVLNSLGVGTNGGSIALPLIAFNLGVELGQIIVAAIALPIIWELRSRPVFVRRWVPASSAMVALFGMIWFVQRVFY